MSVISNQKVEVLVVNKVVFKKHNRGKMLIEMRDKATEFIPRKKKLLGVIFSTESGMLTRGNLFWKPCRRGENCLSYVCE